MPSSQSEWDAKHREALAARPAPPASIVVELLPLLPRGPALDLACGTGRHSLLLAERGQPVVAVDWSSVGLEILGARARDRRLDVHHARSFSNKLGRVQQGITLFQTDLEQVELPPASFDLILCLQYLQRSLFSQMGPALRPGGVLIVETFTMAQLDLPGGPKNAAYMLRPGELRAAFPKLDAWFYRELRAEQGIASIVVQRPEA